MNKCLYCYEKIDGDAHFHPGCSKKIFGSVTPPIIDFTEEHLEGLAAKLIESQSGITGVQAKLSLNIQKVRGEVKKLTIVDYYGGYILKPQSSTYQNLPELEDLCMKMAKQSGVAVVPHSLIRLKSDQLAYITKRIDRDKAGKIPMEDMCQLTERLTEHKYRGSHEQIAKVIIKFSENPLYDVQRFYEQVLFSYLIGNSDMHLKNFSIFKDKKLGYGLTPAYDMLSSLLVTNDNVELALTINGKQNRIKLNDFRLSMANSGIKENVVEKIFKRFSQLQASWFELIDKSFLPVDKQVKFKEMIQQKLSNLNL